MTCPHDPRELVGQAIGMYHCPVCGEMVLAGFPHPSMTDAEVDASYASYMAEQDALIERMAAAAWDVHATRKWAEIPEEWKPFYRRAMVAVLAVVKRAAS